MNKNFNGVDISKYNGNVDFTKLKGEVDFVILRSSIGVPSVNPTLYGTDTKFKANADECVKNAIPFGVYHYSTARTAEQAREEAELVLSSVKGYKLAYPVYIDIEDEKAQGGLTKDEMSEIVIAFIEVIEKAGYFAGIYANKNWLENKVNYSRLTKYAVWIAQWADKVTWTQGNYQMWQYTSNGEVKGINGRVDKNICYVDYPSIMAESGLNGFDKNEKPDNKPQTTVYTVVKGDTMYGIAQKFGVTLDELKKANPQIADYNLIYSGDKINIPVKSNITDYSKGRKLELKNTALYSSAGGEKANTVSGIYYLYDGKDINGYYRITNSADRVGKEPIGANVTGYIKKSDIR